MPRLYRATTVSAFNWTRRLTKVRVRSASNLGVPVGLLMARYGKTPLALNTWYYVAGVYNAKAKTMDVYLNGELDNGFLLGPVMGNQKASRQNVYVGKRSDNDQDDFAGEIGDARIYSLPLTKAEIVASMHGSVHSSGSQAAGRDHSRTPPRSEDQKEECSGSPDPEDKNLPGAAAILGVLAAIACAALLPSSGALSCLIASLAAGLLFVLATASTIPDADALDDPIAQHGGRRLRGLRAAPRSKELKQTCRARSAYRFARLATEFKIRNWNRPQKNLTSAKPT